MNDAAYDVAVVGGGAAGLGAALVLGRARRRVVIFDAGQPRNAGVPHAYGFLGHDGIDPAELLRRGRAEVAGYGVQVIDARVDAVEPLGDERFRVSAGPSSVEARALVLATGLLDPLPDIPGLRDIWGIDAAECPYCHGWEVRDQRIGVVGSSDKLARVSALLTQWSRDVMVISAEATRFGAKEDARLRAAGVQVVASAVARFATAQGRLRAVVLEDGREIERDAIFVAMATRAASDLAARLCDVDAAGFAVVDPEGRTSRPGVWAVGNASDRIAKLVHSAAAGSRAAASINAHLFERDLATALAR